MTGATVDIRAPVVAGSFYPGSATSLAADVDSLLAAADASVGCDATVRGVVAPHAGYTYSGPIAATAYACLSSGAHKPSRIVVSGLSHLEPLQGLAVTTARAWRTPLGEVAIDEVGRNVIVAAGAAVDDAVHRDEHSIEVQLPFLQRCFPGVPVLPVAVGTSSPSMAAEVLASVLDDDALLVVSTDLSHYHDAATARRLDARTATAVEALQPESLRAEDACGVHPLRAAVAWALHLGYRIELLDLRNSADTGGDLRRVVGYGAFAITTG